MGDVDIGRWVVRWAYMPGQVGIHGDVSSHRPMSMQGMGLGMGVCIALQPSPYVHAMPCFTVMWHTPSEVSAGE